MQLTLGQAARHLGVTKPTLSKAVKSGKLSAVRKEDGSYAVEPSELQRYADANQHRFQKNREATGNDWQLEPPPATPAETAAQLPAINTREIELLREMLEDVKRDRDQWREQAQRLALAPPTKPERRGIFGWRKIA